ncbi:MAG: monovalent cation/H+ antiporter subunit D family protein, partial [Deltaproteobacteria bacterium]
FVAVLLVSSLLNVILFFRVIEHAYLEPEEVHAGEGSELAIVTEEAPLSMLMPILIAAAGIMVFGVFSGKIISTVVQFAVPGYF